MDDYHRHKSTVISQHAAADSEKKQNSKTHTHTKQLWQYKRLPVEYCYMALEEQRKSILQILVLQGPLNSLEPETT